jgi:hypothetical protein
VTRLDEAGEKPVSGMAPAGVSGAKLKTPRAAGIVGIVFSALLLASLLLLRFGRL